tara:strand:- start:194 stop:475 length:282 start_codon:yes stop_codon:yes gene_type:complete
MPFGPDVYHREILALFAGKVFEQLVYIVELWCSLTHVVSPSIRVKKGDDFLPPKGEREIGPSSVYITFYSKKYDALQKHHSVGVGGRIVSLCI